MCIVKFDHLVSMQLPMCVNKIIKRQKTDCKTQQTKMDMVFVYTLSSASIATFVSLKSVFTSAILKDFSKERIGTSYI